MVMLQDEISERVKVEVDQEGLLIAAALGKRMTSTFIGVHHKICIKWALVLLKFLTIFSFFISNESNVSFALCLLATRAQQLRFIEGVK